MSEGAATSGTFQAEFYKVSHLEELIFLKCGQNDVLVGLDYIREIQEKNGDIYNCKLCSCVPTTGILEHLFLKEHKSKYLEMMLTDGYSNAIKDINSSPVSESVKEELIDSECLELMMKFGRGRPVVVVPETLGVDDTRMDLSQFDEGGRTVPSTPIQVSPPDILQEGSQPIMPLFQPPGIFPDASPDTSPDASPDTSPDASPEDSPDEPTNGGYVRCYSCMESYHNLPDLKYIKQELKSVRDKLKHFRWALKFPCQLSNSEIRDEMDGFQTSMNGRKKFFGGLRIVRNLIKVIPLRNNMLLENTFVKGFWYSHRDEIN
ncbi:hypothetical protein AVEN_52164-1 [Araneus ventricosus]|uniref:Uncharacterized protein n=1 Tax=Araneus ventricosus TaxID=182803 RepID=A0A4Y2JNG5_ARAVE|nr:hypothetical protein AVEN_52164-1 [Araneus ventricosus]